MSRFVGGGSNSAGCRLLLARTGARSMDLLAVGLTDIKLTWAGELDTAPWEPSVQQQASVAPSSLHRFALGEPGWGMAVWQRQSVEVFLFVRSGICCLLCLNLTLKDPIDLAVEIDLLLPLLMASHQVESYFPRCDPLLLVSVFLSVGKLQID